MCLLIKQADKVPIACSCIFQFIPEEYKSEIRLKNPKKKQIRTKLPGHA